MPLTNRPIQAAPPANPLGAMTNLLQTDLQAVNALIMQRMQSEVTLIPELAGHLIAAGGKRIRPLLTLASAALFGYEGTRQHRLAACVEFIHTATLLHDDVVDASDQRRGRSSANALFGNEAAVLVGDFLFSRAFQLMTEDGSLEVLRILSGASAVIAEGEVLQLAAVNDIGTDEAHYKRVIAAKTAELFAAACEVGAVVAERGAEECAALRNYGMNLGMAFQIADDVLDYAARRERLGKSLGDDFKEGKMTLPVIRAIARADAAERKFWSRCIGDMEQSDADFAQACAILARHDALEESLAEARRYAEQGIAALAAVGGSPLRGHLEDLIVFAVDRDY
ncbi:MAG: polyprenyl synthetase family protein [Alphaproteobacteria bacterium]|nr:polyprenyl synthetase family protein [Alphaproteobacteria bacterium]MDE2337548.1 polyprenyl synthetase family protein [Alphaproteobacteria bacterium]